MTGKRLTEKEINAIRKMAKTMSTAEISRKTGRSYSAIYSAAERHGISFEVSCVQRHTGSEGREIVRLRNSGMTYPQIAKTTGVNVSSCRYLYRTYA